jgi:hypothetical protein
MSGKGEEKEEKKKKKKRPSPTTGNALLHGPKKKFLKKMK